MTNPIVFLSRRNERDETALTHYLKNVYTTTMISCLIIVNVLWRRPWHAEILCCQAGMAKDNFFVRLHAKGLLPSATNISSCIACMQEEFFSAAAASNFMARWHPVIAHPILASNNSSWAMAAIWTGCVVGGRYWLVFACERRAAPNCPFFCCYSSGCFKCKY
jgi:hypothetical protein